MTSVSQYAQLSQAYTTNLDQLQGRLYDISSPLGTAATAMSLPRALEAKIRDTHDNLNLPLATKALMGLLPYVGASMKKIFKGVELTQKQLDLVADKLHFADDVVKTPYLIIKPASDYSFYAWGATKASYVQAVVASDEANHLAASLSEDEIPSESRLSGWIDDDIEAMQDWLPVGNAAVDALNDFAESLADLGAQIESAVNQTYADLVTDATDAVNSLVVPLKTAMTRIETEMNKVWITVQPEIRDPLFGVVIVKEKKERLSTIIKNIDSYIQRVQDAAESAVRTILNKVGIAWTDISSTIENELNKLLAPIMEQVDGMAAALEPLMDALQAKAAEAQAYMESLLADMFDASSLFDAVQFGDEAPGLVDFADYLEGNFDLGTEALFGLKGNDTLITNWGSDFLFGGIGNDTMSSGLGEDELFGGAGDDSADGGAGDDMFWMGTGRDTANGGSGDDLIDGGDQGDVLNGGEGNDKILGGRGFDRLLGGGGSDTLVGGGGNDRAFGGTGNDKLIGWTGHDVLKAGAGRDAVYGGNGNDIIVGGAGDDTLSGGAGRDTINGGLGDDLLIGGGHADVFVFRGAFGHDVIRGWQDGLDLMDIGTAPSSIETVGGDAVVHVGANSILIEGAAGLIDLDDLTF